MYFCRHNQLVRAQLSARLVCQIYLVSVCYLFRLLAALRVNWEELLFLICLEVGGVSMALVLSSIIALFL